MGEVEEGEVKVCWVKGRREMHRMEVGKRMWGMCGGRGN